MRLAANSAHRSLMHSSQLESLFMWRQPMLDTFNQPASRLIRVL